MPTTIRDDILKLTDSHGQEIGKVEFVDPKNPKILIDPSIGSTYETTVFLFNSSEWNVFFIKFVHSYEDVRIIPEFIQVLKPHQKVALKVVFKPFTESGISSKIKGNKLSINFSPKCMVEVVSEIPEEDKK